jgi:Mg2+/Co2+ transporter CorB
VLTVLLTALTILLLLVVSAFFSASETALTATHRARIHMLGTHRAHLVERLIGDRERLIGAILLGNNFVNILASALATSLFIVLFGERGVVYATIVVTALVLIFGEVLPKTYAIANPDRLALIVAPALSIFVALFAPIVMTIQFIVRRTLRLAGIDVDLKADILSAREELRDAIELHHKEGGMEMRNRAMLGGVLDLSDLVVGDAMVHRKSMMSIDMSSPEREIIDQMLASPFSRLPLWRDYPDNIVGILHVKDLLRALHKGERNLSANEIYALASKPWYVPETTNLQEQLAAFLQRKVHFALVVDEYGDLMGLITLEDILEEIVGDIADEHDLPVTGVRPQPDGSVHVDGVVPIRDLNRAMTWRLPDEQATTVAGLVIHEAQTIPEVGQVFRFYDFRFEILRRKRNQITALRITPTRKGESSVKS